ncbi:unnamed protein product [Nezara viridula]|uniref:Uncharacterized protein n=1 Tax=Nezara viridula TaxID=85310 RepID=A0A9P0MZ72_NEZVI|nr:unnamed protein product [Nezara viridula]
MINWIQGRRIVYTRRSVLLPAASLDRISIRSAIVERKVTERCADAAAIIQHLLRHHRIPSPPRKILTLYNLLTLLHPPSLLSQGLHQRNLNPDRTTATR